MSSPKSNWSKALMALAAPLMLVACTAAGLPKVHKWPEPFPGAPALLEPVGSMSAVSTTAQWQTERAPYFRELLLNEIYGSIPPATPFKPVSRKVLSEDILGGEASTTYDAYRLIAEGLEVSVPRLRVRPRPLPG